jgi:hypothetical protein
MEEHFGMQKNGNRKHILTKINPLQTLSNQILSLHEKRFKPQFR